MASNKKTTEPIFSNATEMMWFQDRNCQYCTKYTQYNEKLGKFPQFRCAVQRDMEGQAVGIDEVSQRSYDACQQKTCPFLKPKDNDTNSKHKEIGQHVAPKPTKATPLFKEQAPINIQEQAEKSIREREAEVEAQAQAERARAEKEEKDKMITNALAKAFDRRMERSAFAVQKPAIKTKRDVPPEIVSAFQQKGKNMKLELDCIIRVHLSSLHIILQAMLDIGDGVMQDCIRDIKARGLYKMEMKRQVNKAQQAYDKIFNRLSLVTREVQELRNIVLDTLTDNTAKDITNLTYSLKSVLDKHKIKDSLLIARIDTAWILFESARQETEFIYETAKNQLLRVFAREKVSVPPGFIEEINAFFVGKNPSGIAKEWQKVSEMIMPSIKSVASEIENDRNVKNAIAIIHRKLSNVRDIEELSNSIIENEPELIDKYKQNHPNWEQTIEVAI